VPYREDSLQARLLLGDPAAIGLVRRWIAEALTATQFWHLRREWKDLQQEVLFRLVDSLRRERFRQDGEFKSYVQGVCRHTAQSWQSKQARRSSLGVLMGEPVDEDSGATAEQRLISDQLVRRALDEATPDCRALIRAYFLEGLPYAELASRLDVPVGTVKSRLFRCLQCLRDSMAPATHRAGKLTP